MGCLKSKRDRLLPIIVLWSILLVRCDSIFDGVYSIVNKHNGLRIFASLERGFSADSSSESVYPEQLWRFVDQGDDKHAIFNAANGLRMVAKVGADGDSDFFVIEGGPVYQDQNWFLYQENDGSYIITNAKSRRRIASASNGEGRIGIVAVASEGPIHANHAWWLIKEQQDNSQNLVAELQMEQRLRVELVKEVKIFKGEVDHLMLQLQMANATNVELTNKLQVLSTDASHRYIELQLAMADKSKLFAELELNRQMSSQLAIDWDVCQNETSRLVEELHIRNAESADLALELQNKKDALSRHVADIDDLHGQLERLSMDLHAARFKNIVSAQEIEAVQTLLHEFKAFVAYTSTCFAIGVITIMTALALHCKHAQFRLAVEVEQQQILITQLQDDLEKESIVQNREVVGELGYDFSFQVISRVVDCVTERLIKIQCPGVGHADIDVNLIFNGCEVTIRRPASCGTKATTWKKRFRFKTSDGLFEFKEDQMQLEQGFLHLIFSAYAFRSRLIRFPCHFSLDASDTDQCWDYPEYNSDDLSHSPSCVSWVEPVLLAETDSTASTTKDVPSAAFCCASA